MKADERERLLLDLITELLRLLKLLMEPRFSINTDVIFPKATTQEQVNQIKK